MKKNLLKIYESFFDDLDKLNKDDGFRGTNDQVYDQHDYILGPYKNPEFFKGLCNFCKNHYPGLPSNENGFTQNDLDKIIHIDTLLGYSYFKKVTSLDELQYFHNLEEIHYDCFNKCEEIKSVIFPENLKIINNGSFADCISLEEIILPENIKKISNGAFYDCSSLKKIIIPERFKDNMKYIFYEVNLTKVDIIYI